MQLLIKAGAGILLVAIVLLALLSGAIRLVVSNIEYFKSEIDYLIERDVADGFGFTGLGGAMNRWNPVLAIENVSITLPDRSQPLFVDRLTVEFDFWASLREWAPVVLEISGQLEKVELHKDAAGKWWANELALAVGGGEISMPGFERVLALTPRYLKLNLNRLLVNDQAAGGSYRLQQVQALIDHRGQQFFVRLSAVLPEQLGRSLLVKSVIGPERSLVYVNSSDLRLNPVARLFDLDTWGLQQGALDGEVWIDMSGYRVLSVSGDLVLKKGLVQMAADKTPLEVSYHSRFNAEDRDSGWHISNRVERLQIDGERVPPFRTQLAVASPGGQQRIDAWVDRLQVANLPVVAGQWLPRELNQQIARGNLQGTLRDVLLSIDLEQPQRLLLAGRAENLSSRRFDEFPGIENVDAEFIAGGNRIGVKLEGKRVGLDFGDHFNAPLEIDSLRLDANLERIGQTLLLAVDRVQLENQDIAASGRMWMQADHLQPPFMYIRANFTDGNGASTGKYIPRTMMPRRTQEWLDRAIVAGHVEAGDMMFHGRLRDIRELARDRAGEFYVDFGVERARIDFSPGWLPARDATGRVLFHNAGVEFDIESVSYDRIEQARVSGGIPEFDSPELRLEIESAPDTARAVQTWLDTPVGKRYRQVMQNVDSLDGIVRTRVELNLPLADGGGDPRVEVAAEFENAAARADAWGLELTRVDGRLVITESEISAQQLRARFFGDPVSIDIASRPASGETLVNASGVIESKNLLRSLPDAVTAEIEGKSDWQVRLVFVEQRNTLRQPFLRLNAASNLRDTGITLPQPFAKTAAEPLRVSADLDFFEDGIELTASLGDDRHARGRLEAADGGGFRIETLDLALQTPLGPGPLRGLNLYGRWPEVDAQRWTAIIAASGAARPELLQAADLEIERLQLFQQTLENVDLKLERRNRRLIGAIDSSLVKGKFEVPLKPTQRDPVTADLDYLVIEATEQRADYSALRPGQLKSFRLRSDSLTYRGIELSDLVVDARVGDNLLRFDRISLRRDRIVLEAGSKWEYFPASDSHESSLSAKISGEDFGAAIAGLGFGDSMSGGSVEFDVGLTWQAPLPGFELDSLKGDARLKIEDDVLNNVEPGSGRFVGLLSLSALPRRLSLDFSDLLVEGMEFDTISGRYQLEKGVIHTRNTRMDGPAAKIKISGKTNIVERSYDQQIKVTPKIRQTLPLIGAVSAGSTVGWGLLLLQNLFKKEIDDAVEVEYRVTGSWDDPQIELIKAVDENQQELPDLGDRSR